MNGKRCNRCGTVNTMDAVYCSNCGQYLDGGMNGNINNNMNNSMNNSVDMDKKKADNMATIAALLFYLGAEVVSIISNVIPGILGDLIYDMRGLCSIAGIVVMIVGRVRYPDNKSLKIVMWAIIVTIAVIVIFVILYIVSITSIIDRVSTSYGILLPYRVW